MSRNKLLAFIVTIGAISIIGLGVYFTIMGTVTFGTFFWTVVGTGIMAEFLMPFTTK